MGILMTHKVDLNEIRVVDRLRAAVQDIASRSDSYYTLEFKQSFYFRVPDPGLSTEAGWYIILNGKRPVYVGQAENLHARLSTNNKSSDNFANGKRKKDPERNFIKKFIEIGVFRSPRVCIIRKNELSEKIGISYKKINDVDIDNIEKFINLMRDEILYL